MLERCTGVVHRGGQAGDSRGKGQPCTAPYAALKVADGVSKPTHCCQTLLHHTLGDPKIPAAGCTHTPVLGDAEPRQDTKSIRAGPRSATVNTTGLTQHRATLNLTQSSTGLPSRRFAEHHFPGCWTSLGWTQGSVPQELPCAQHRFLARRVGARNNPN